jgi:hypothetical protein
LWSVDFWGEQHVRADLPEKHRSVRFTLKPFISVLPGSNNFQIHAINSPKIRLIERMP